MRFEAQYGDDFGQVRRIGIRAVIRRDTGAAGAPFAYLTWKTLVE